MERFHSLVQGACRLFFRLPVLTGVLAMLCSVSASADAIGQLKQFLNGTSAYSAEFDQVVLDENLRQIDEAAGTLSISRPGRFRWDYDPPTEQIIVGDGQKVWIYDIELKQVIVRDQQRSLGQSPAILLSGQGDAMRNFRLENRGQQGAIEWVAAIPNSENSGFEEIRIGFERGELTIMELRDGLGQTTRIRFYNGLLDPSLPGDQFRFAVPAGVDVIDESQ